MSDEDRENTQEALNDDSNEKWMRTNVAKNEWKLTFSGDFVDGCYNEIQDVQVPYVLALNEKGESKWLLAE